MISLKCVEKKIKMNKYTVEDLLYGFHFSFSFVSPLCPVKKPLLASLRVQNEDNDACYGKEYVFSVSSSNGEFHVDAQLPWDMKFDSSSFIAVRVSDRHDDAVLEVPVHAFWLERQKEKILSRRDVDVMRCADCNALQMDKISVGHKKHTSNFWMRRMGRKVGNSDSTVTSVQGIDYKLMLLDKEFEHFKNWMLQYSSSLEMGFIMGHRFLPIYAMLCMADAREEWSFSHQGWIQAKKPDKIWIRSWKKDWHDVFRFASIFGYKGHSQFWKAVELISCNASSRQKGVPDKNRFTFPQFNGMQRNQIDQTSATMLVLDMLYQMVEKSKKTGAKWTGVTHMENTWPCVCVARNTENDLILLHGLLNRTLLNQLVVENRMECNSLLNLHPNKLGLEKIKLVTLSWRDYTENVLCSAMLFNAFSKGLGIDCIESDSQGFIVQNNDATAQVYVQKYANVCMPFQHAFSVNGAHALRPIIAVGKLLLQEKDITLRCKKLPWHLGYVVETRSFWTKKHILSTLDVARSISMEVQCAKK